MRVISISFGDGRTRRGLKFLMVLMLVDDIIIGSDCILNLLNCDLCIVMMALLMALMLCLI